MNPITMAMIRGQSNSQCSHEVLGNFMLFCSVCCLQSLSETKTFKKKMQINSPNSTPVRISLFVLVCNSHFNDFALTNQSINFTQRICICARVSAANKSAQI